MASNPGSAALAGNSGGDGGNVQAASGDQQQIGGVDVTGAPPEKPWFEAAGIDPKFHGAITAKGWQNQNDVLDSYTNVERLVSMERGGDIDRILVKPKDGATPEEIATFNAKAGFAAPDKIEDYGFTPETIATKTNDLFTASGLPPELAGQFAAEMTPVVERATQWFKDSGLPPQAASALVDKVLQGEVEGLKAFDAKCAQEYAALGQELGDKLGDFEEAGRRAFRQSGLEPQLLDKIEMAIGTKNMMTMFSKFGSAMGEAAAPSGDKSGGQGQFVQTAQNALSRIQTLQSDSDFQAKLMSTNPQVKQAAQKEWEALFSQAYPS